MNIIFRCFIIALLSISSHTCFAQKDTLRVLFVGNSYTYYSVLPKMVSELSKSTTTFIKTEMSTVGGARLKYHHNQEHGLKTKNLIKKSNFDIVVLQGHSMATLTHKTQFIEYSKKLSNYIKQHGATPYFFTTWSREKTPETQKTITKVYNDVALQNNGVVVLVGEAWKLAKQLKPSFNIYDTDGSHPTKLGTFLSACVFVKALTGQVPSIVNVPTTKRLDLSDIQFCLQVVNSMPKK